MSSVQNLEVYNDKSKRSARRERDLELLPTNSTRYRVVESVILLGLRILESPQGKNSLIRIATEVVQQRDFPPGDRPPVPHIYNRPLAEMPRWVDFFFGRLRSNFPVVLLCDIAGEASATKKDWGTDMSQYDPQEASHFEFNKTIINNMIYVRHQPPNVTGDNYNCFKFQMAITIAHEIVHLLTGFLTGTARPYTPPGVSLGNYGNRNMGESGRYWESILLGGVVEFFEDGNDPLQERQAGRPYLIEDSRNNVPAQLVSTTYINNFLNGHFSFPILTSSRAAPTTRNELRRISREMTDVRERSGRRARAAPAYESPAPEASSSVSYRRLPPTHHSYSGSYSTYYAQGNGEPSDSHAGAYGSNYGSSHNSGYENSGYEDSGYGNSGYENSYGDNSSGYGYHR